MTQLNTTIQLWMQIDLGAVFIRRKWPILNIWFITRIREKEEEDRIFQEGLDSENNY